MNYGMPGYIVPHTVYPAGYHYAPTELMDWFVGEYAKTAKHKIDIGKSCIRFKYYDEIPFDLNGELVRKMDTKEWIRVYEENLKK